MADIAAPEIRISVYLRYFPPGLDSLRLDTVNIGDSASTISREWWEFK